MYEIMPTILMSSYLREEKDSRKLAAISVVAAGFGGDMPEDEGWCPWDRLDVSHDDALTTVGLTGYPAWCVYNYADGAEYGSGQERRTATIYSGCNGCGLGDGKA